MVIGGVVRRIVERLPMRYRGAFLLLLAITLIDFLLPDVIPFVDEIVLALLTVLFGLWRDRRAAKPPRAVMLLVLSQLAMAASTGCVTSRDRGATARAAPAIEGARAPSAENSAPAPQPKLQPQPRPSEALMNSVEVAAPPPKNPWSGAARDALVAPCGRCHQSSLPTADPKALAIFDLDQPEWSATMSREQLEALGGRARRSSSMAPAEKDAIERFLQCALDGDCSKS